MYLMRLNETVSSQKQNTVNHYYLVLFVTVSINLDPQFDAFPSITLLLSIMILVTSQRTSRN